MGRAISRFDPHTPDLFLSCGSPGEPATPAPKLEVSDASHPAPTLLETCAGEVQRYTGLDFHAALFVVVVFVSSLLVGVKMMLGERLVKLSTAWFFPQYTSSSMAALRLGEKLLLNALTAEPPRILLHSGASVESIAEDRLALAQGMHTVSLGVSGPFRGVPSKKDVEALDFWASTLRGEHPRDICLWQLWAGSAWDLATAIESGKSVGFGDLIGCITCRATGDVATAIPDDVSSFELAKLFRGIAEASGQQTKMVFTPLASAEVLDAARGSLNWGDAIRQIAGLAAALHVIEDIGSTQVGAVTVKHAVALFQESERQKKSLLSTMDKQDGNGVRDGLVKALQKAENVLAYMHAKAREEMSPRELVIHGLADDVAEAKLIFAILETRKQAIQELYIHNNRPLQKWKVNGQRSPSSPEEENQSKTESPAHGDPLTAKGEAAQ